MTTPRTQTQSARLQIMVDVTVAAPSDGDGWTIDAMHAQVAREGEALIRQLCILNSGVAVHSVRCVEVVTSSKVRP